MTVYRRYAEDPTGSNPDNLVSEERISLNDRVIRVAVPKYGPFFTESLVVYDGLTQRRLEKGLDYRVPTIARDATLKFGLEVADALLIENTDVASQIIVTYQAVGGLFQNNIDNLANMYEAWLNDDRKIDWLTGIMGKPSEYPPSPHPHWLTEVFGFETMNYHLERIAQAIQLGDSPAFQALLDALESRFASYQEMDIGKPVKKIVTLERLLDVVDKYNFNTVTMKPSASLIPNGGTIWWDVAATNVPDQVTWYWTIQHIGTDHADFVANSGVLPMSNGTGRFMIQATRTFDREEAETFRVQLRRNGPDGQVIATSRLMTSAAHLARYFDRILDALKVQRIHTPQLRLTPKTYSVARSYANATFN